MKIGFANGSLVELSPDQTIGSVPQSLVAESLQGLVPSNFIQATTSGTQDAFGILTAGGSSNASHLHNHDNDYVKLNSPLTQAFGVGGISIQGNLSVGLSSPTNAKIAVGVGQNGTEVIKGKFAGTNTASDLGRIRFGGGEGLTERAFMEVRQSYNSSTTDTELGFFTTKGGVGGAERLSILGNGNVGIGIRNPSSKLVVSNDTKEGIEFFPGSGSKSSTISAYNRTIPSTPPNTPYDKLNIDTDGVVFRGLGSADQKNWVAVGPTGNMALGSGATGSFTIDGVNQKARLEVNGIFSANGVTINSKPTVITQIFPPPSTRKSTQIINLPWKILVEANTTGYIKLVTPIETNESNMFSIKIRGYRYLGWDTNPNASPPLNPAPAPKAGDPIDIHCTGYAYRVSTPTPDPSPIPSPTPVVSVGEFRNSQCNTSGTDLAVEIDSEERSGKSVVVIRIGTPTSTWYFPNFTAEYIGWQNQDPSDFQWIIGETTPPPKGNTNNVIIHDGKGQIVVKKSGQSPQFAVDIEGPIRSSIGGFVFPDGTVQSASASQSAYGLSRTTFSNLVRGGSFESGDDNFFPYSGGQLLRLELPNTPIGKYSMQLTATSSSSSNFGGMSKELITVTSKTYTLSFWAKSLISGPASIRFSFQDGSGNENELSGTFQISDAWKFYSKSATVSVGRSKMYIWTHVASQQWLMDGIQVEENSSASPFTSRSLSAGDFTVQDGSLLVHADGSVGIGTKEDPLPPFPGPLAFFPVLPVQTPGFWVNADGNVGIGTKGPLSPLSVVTTKISGNIAEFRSTGSGGAGCNIAWNGTSCSSDQRLKKDIAPLTQSLEKILALRGVQFTWKADPDGKSNIGFIAQELEKIYPELVSVDSQGMKQVNYANLAAALADAIRQIHENHTKEIETMKSDAAAKNQELSNIKSYLCARDFSAALCTSP